MHIPMQTDRLILRPFEIADAEAAFGWFGDPEVMRFTPSGPDASLEQTQTRLATYCEHQTVNGFSKLILNRASNFPIGDSGLLCLPQYGWIDFGFRLARAYWGKGLATEAAGAWVQAAFNELRLEPLVAMVHPENAASIRVLEKLRFREDRHDTILGMNSILCRLDADEPADRVTPGDRGATSK
jgi:RimJ/RimL family protein N-acetyltransferase